MGGQHFKTQNKPQRKVVDFSKFDLSCLNPVQWIDMDTNFSGDITERFDIYTQANNLRLVTLGLAPFQEKLPPDAVEIIAAYPESFQCVE